MTRTALSAGAARHVLAQPALIARRGDRVGDVFARLHQRTVASVELVCIADDDGRLLGSIPLAGLTGQPADKPLLDFDWRPALHVHVDDDQEHIATKALRARQPALAAVDASGRLVGVVDALTLLQILRDEHHEDLHRLAGVRHQTSIARRAMQEPPARRVRDRLPWLLVGLVGSALATALMTRFEATLERTVAVAFFLPGLVYLADAVGTQTEAIVVRGLSLAHGHFVRQWLKEAMTGAWIGLVLGSLAALGAFVAFADARLAAAVGLAVFSAGAVAASLGFALPWALSRAGVDPAYGSGPLATIIQDVLTIAIYFGFVGWLVA